MANRPDADPNTTRTPLKNYAVVDMYEPGSTFKLVTLSGLYDNRLARPDEQIFCENGTYVFAHRSKPVRDVHPYGMLSVVDVIGKSSNICTIKLGQRLGSEGMFEYARRFGFGLRTGIDFPGEARGVLRLPRVWSALSPYSIAMGYEVSASPLQLAMMFGTVANGGELLQPYLVTRVVGPGGEVLRREGPRRVRRVVTPETARMVTDALVQVVNEGTGTAADLDLLQVAGKSGTAYKTRPEGGYATDRYNSSFGGFFPADNPRFVVFVRLDDPRGEHYGGLVAGPVFKKAIETTLLAERMQVESSFLARIRRPNQVVQLASTTSASVGEVAYGPAPEPAGTSPEDLAGADAGDGGAPVETAGATVGSASLGECSGCQAAVPPPGEVRVPDFTTMSLREAVVVASQRRLQLRFSGTGDVVRQAPPPGEIVPAGSLVRVDNDEP
jgi:membrane peptidoglycan carboxypeptidase